MANHACPGHVTNNGIAGDARQWGPTGRQVMGKEKILILAIFLAVIAAAVGIGQFDFSTTTGPGVRASGAGSSAGRDSRPLPPPLKTPPTSQYRGFALQLHSADRAEAYKKFIDEIADTGANAISFGVAGYQEDCASSSIFIDARRSPSKQDLKALITHARRRGLRVMLMPIVLLENPRSGEWRGKIDPRDWDDWWEDYTNYILHYAAIAQQGGVEIFAVGSELISTERDHADRWRGLIAAVRKRFKGHLIYSANWDHYRPITWWDAVDIVGMTTYYDLTGGKKPTVERLVESWKPIRQEVLDWQKSIGRPILFTEVGWPNQVTCAQYPWDYTRSPGQPDPAAQANCFEAFFRTWIQEPSVAGFLVWEWKTYPGQVTSPDKDTGYVPCGKPAMTVIERYYELPDPTSRPARMIGQGGRN